MKKRLYLTILIATTSILLAKAQSELVSQLSDSYAGTLTVSINGTSTPPTEETIEIVKQNDNNLIGLNLTNFKLAMPDDNGSVDYMYIGNIYINDIPLEQKGDTILFAKSQDITISAGDSPSGATWIGPFIGNVPIELKGRAYDAHIELSIDINMAGLGQTIKVDFCSVNVKPTNIIVPRSAGYANGVYTLQGHCVSTNCNTLHELPSGVYIIFTEGRSSKVIVR